MKILLAVHQFFPEYVSGTEVLTFVVARELQRRGHEVRVLAGAPAPGPLPDAERFDEYEIEGLHVHRFHHSFVPMGGQRVLTELEYANTLATRFFRTLLSEFQPDVVHIFHMSRLGAAIIDVAVGLGVPIFFTPTDFWSVCPTNLMMLEDGAPCGGPTAAGVNCVKHVASRIQSSPWIGAVARHTPDFVAGGVVRLARSPWLARVPFRDEIAALSNRHDYIVSRLNTLSGIISPTSLMTAALVRNGVRPELVRQHMYGIALDDYDSKVRTRKPSKTLTFGFIGGLTPHKGCHVLIEAFKRMKPGSARLKVYGNPYQAPSYFEGLQKQAAGYDAIEFCGTFPNTAIAGVLACIDALVVPSVWLENAPLVIHAALAARCPVIASDYPGMSELVRDGENGLLFTPGSADSLAQALGRLLDEQALLQELSAACRPVKSIGQYVEELLASYEPPATRHRHP